MFFLSLIAFKVPFQNSVIYSYFTSILAKQESENDEDFPTSLDDNELEDLGDDKKDPGTVA